MDSVGADEVLDCWRGFGGLIVLHHGVWLGVRVAFSSD